MADIGTREVFERFMFKRKHKIYLMGLSNRNEDILIRIGFSNAIDMPYDFGEMKTVSITSKRGFLKQVHEELLQMGFAEYSCHNMDWRWFTVPEELKQNVENDLLSLFRTVRNALADDDNKSRYTLDSNFED